mmetsp:Transcript_19605/g.61411  ORF Transcript_19605/g.61411 Transcript_19605/m.61411 type:complete len:145 (+) Transcript_19605:620-1054(+)
MRAALLVAAAAAWPPLDRALNDYAALHAAEAEKFAHGDPSGRYVVVAAHHGLGNREHALLSAFALALATRKALFVDWEASQKCAPPPPPGTPSRGTSRAATRAGAASRPRRRTPSTARPFAPRALPSTSKNATRRRTSAAAARS